MIWLTLGLVVTIYTFLYLRADLVTQTDADTTADD